MAWNEPGGSGDKDPWGGRGKDQGPPDLDEVVRNIQKKFGGLFGGKSGGGKSNGASGGGMGGVGSLGIGIIAAVAIAAWGFSGLYTVEEGTRGVVLHFGEYSETTMPGLHWYPRFIQSVEPVDIENIRGMSIGFRASAGSRSTGSSVGRESLMLTQDENIVDVKLAVQYKVKSASDFLFKVRDPEVTLRQAVESAIREIVGKNDMDFILNERAVITAQAKEVAQNIVDRYETGLIITTVNMQDAQPPEQVQDAFADAVKAQGDQARVINEAEAYSNDIIPRARGKAARQMAEANAYKEQVIAESTGEASRFSQILAAYKKAPKVTRKRLYLEAVESVMANTSKVLVDVKGGGNLLYLPLDKMMNSSTKDNSGSRRILEGGASSDKLEDEQSLRDNLRGRGVR
jgi:membrane protease subunit HflK